MKKYALLSVSDKSGILEFAQGLIECGYTILSTGGTAKALIQANINVVEVADYTGFPEMLDGRVKTLNPKVHGAILAVRDNPEHMASLKEYNIPTIDIVCVNLYPFSQTIQNLDAHLSHAIENIDIGGPAMLRSSAKNYKHVTVIVDANDYTKVLSEVKNGQVSLQTKFQLARKVFNHTAQYDGAISNYLSSICSKDASINQDNKNLPNISEFPRTYNLQFNKIQDLRYGENPHQKAAFYRDINPTVGTIATSTKLQGKELSYNNIADADTAWECVKTFTENPACVIVKHANPCGVGIGETSLSAYEKAWLTDTTSAFGGIIAFNICVDELTAKQVIQQFVEVIIAPSYETKALEIFATKPNVRVLQCKISNIIQKFDIKRIGGGILLQTSDSYQLQNEQLNIVTQKKPSQIQLQDMLFAWKVAKFVKSNAIIFCKNGQTLGIGAGQMSRVDSARIASIKAQNANLYLADSAVASDAFFPFKDGLDVVADAGASCIIQPGGSIRDDEIIARANERGLIMAFTGIRHFKH